MINTTLGTTIETFYWREGSKEVDFVIPKVGNLIAIEVKSSQPKESLSGLQAFSQKFNPQKKLLVGGQSIPLEEFLLTYPEQFI